MLNLLVHCDPNALILRELETLDLSQICAQLQTAGEHDVHRDMHRFMLRRATFDGVLEWLQVRGSSICTIDVELILFFVSCFLLAGVP